MPERVTICNTSPLLYLHIVGQLELLPQLYDQVLIPPAVQAELEAGAQRGISVPVVKALSWLRVTPLASRALLPLATDLGQGEAEVIGLGAAIPGLATGLYMQAIWLYLGQKAVDSTMD